MNSFKKITILSFSLLSIFLTSCEKEEGPLSDLRPATPIIVENAMAFRPDPTVFVSKSAVVSPGVFGPIEIVLTIPTSSPRTFASITKVAASTSYSQIQSSGTTGFYTTAPIAASGKRAVFTTNLTEYVAKTGQAISASNTELTRRFYFMVTLDDGSIIITEPVRILVLD